MFNKNPHTLTYLDANLNIGAAGLELSAWLTILPKVGATLALLAEVVEGAFAAKLKLNPPTAAGGLLSSVGFPKGDALTSPFVAGALNENIGTFACGVESSPLGFDLLLGDDSPGLEF